MTHTEESLMAIHNRCMARMRDYCEGNKDERDDAEQALRLAIREVLAERDEARKSDGWQWVDSARADRAAAVSQWRAAKAECERLRKELEKQLLLKMKEKP